MPLTFGPHSRGLLWAVGARTIVVLAGGLSSASLLLVPVALAAPLGDDPLANGLAFGGLILLWSLGVAAQGPALTAVAQQLALAAGR